MIMNLVKRLSGRKSSISSPNYNFNNDYKIINEIKEKEYLLFSDGSRPWRFTNINYFLNNLTLRLSQTHKLKYMNSVIHVINEVNKISDINRPFSEINLVLFVDIDNWGRFFQLPELLPKKTYVYCFKGGKNGWKPPEE